MHNDVLSGTFSFPPGRRGPRSSHETLGGRKCLLPSCSRSLIVSRGRVSRGFRLFRAFCLRRFCYRPSLCCVVFCLTPLRGSRGAFYVFLERNSKGSEFSSVAQIFPGLFPRFPCTGETTFLLLSLRKLQVPHERHVDAPAGLAPP